MFGSFKVNLRDIFFVKMEAIKIMTVKNDKIEFILTVDLNVIGLTILKISILIIGQHN